MADLRLTRWVLQQLRLILQTRTARRTDERLDALVQWAAGNTRRVDALVAATQTLRDLGEIAQAEAAYILDYLVDVLLWSGESETDPGIVALILDSDTDPELPMIAMGHRDTMLGVDFYTA